MPTNANNVYKCLKMPSKRIMNVPNAKRPQMSSKRIMNVPNDYAPNAYKCLVNEL